MHQILAGGLAGFVATVPMTAVMSSLYRRLPRHERYPLPPREITMNAAEKADVKEDLDEPERLGLTLAAHFGYGAATGAVYGLLAPRVPLPPAVKGIAYGLGVWAGSYMGFLPATGLFRHAKQEPPRRNALMIAAHVVWGAATGLLAERMDPS